MVAKKRITDDPTGLAQLIGVLAAVGDTAEDPIPVAIETKPTVTRDRVPLEGARAEEVRKPLRGIRIRVPSRYRCEWPGWARAELSHVMYPPV